MVQDDQAGDPQPQLPVFRSMNSRSPVRVDFCNRSPRSVELLWINYKGEPQSYGVVGPRTGKRIFTFVGHPWMIRDAESQDPMMVNNKDVYMPNALENAQATMVDITLPVFSLRDRCLQVVRKLVRSEDFPHLEIARSLQEDLAQTPSILADLKCIRRRISEATENN